MMSDAEVAFATTVEEALEKYMRDIGSDGEVLADWSVVYSRQIIDEDEGVIWANSIISKRGANPNGHIGLHEWGAGVIADIMHDSVDLDE